MNSKMTEYEIELPAGDANMEEEYNKYLREHSYPEEVIEMYHIDQKRELYDLGGIFLGSSGEVSTLMEVPTNPDIDFPDEIKPLSMGDTKFTHSVTASRIRSTKRGLVDIKINYNWDWPHKPTFSYTDAYVVAYIGDFIVRKDTPMQSYKIFACNPAGLYYESPGQQYQRHATYDPGKGVGWRVDLVNLTTHNTSLFYTYRHKGWSGVKIQQYYNGSGLSVKSPLAGDYWHLHTSATPSVSWSAGDKYPSISLEFTGKQDLASTAIGDFKWSHTDYIIQ